MNIVIEPFQPDADTLDFLNVMFGISRADAELDHYSRAVDRAFRSVPYGQKVNMICPDRRTAKICQKLMGNAKKRKPIGSLSEQPSTRT